ncbi:MAG: hypothetical protein Q8P41_02880 [Pseudomonadota bacterium]|nr:hypothetical protein [Pseudomonadota bacterium]
MPFLLLLLTLTSLSARAADPVASAPLRWSEAPAATWTVVLETAGPMLDQANAAREPIARLVETLPVGDRLEIVVLHTRSSFALPLRTIDDAGRAALAAEIRALELPTARSTDLAAGLSVVGASLGAQGAAAPRFVLMLSSFCHSPPLESTYADGGFGCRAIRGFDKFDAGFDAAGDHTTVDAVLFPVATAKQKVDDRGLADTQAYFAPAAAVEVAKEPFAAWVDALRANVEGVRLRPLVRGEVKRLALTARVGEGPTLDRPSGTLLLGTGLANLTFDVRKITVEGARTDVQTLQLAPDGTVPILVDVPAAPFSLFPANDTVDIPVRLRVEGTLSPADTLRGLGIDPERTDLVADVTIRAERHYGLSPVRSLGMAASLGLLLVAGVLGLRRRVAPLRLGGAFSYRRAGGARQTLAIEHLSEAPIVVLPDGTLGIGRREHAVLVLRVERPVWNTRSTAEIRSGSAEINARPAAPGRHSVVPGATSFQFLDYRLSWE